MFCRCEGRKKESEFTIKRERYHRIVLWIIQKMTKFTNARGRRKRCTRTSSGHMWTTNASFSFEAAQIEREREKTPTIRWFPKPHIKEYH